MAPIAVGDIIRVTARMRLLTSDDVVNTYHMRVQVNTTVDDDAFMVEVAADIDALYQGLNVDISTQLTYIDIDAQNITQNELLPGKPWPVLIQGGDAGNLLPTQTCAYVFFRTLRPKTRAAVYIPGYTESSNGSLGEIGPSAGPVLQAFANLLEAGFSGPNFTAEYGAYNRPLDRFTPVDQGIVPLRWRTQRRRRIGVGS